MQKSTSCQLVAAPACRAQTCFFLLFPSDFAAPTEACTSFAAGATLFCPFLGFVAGAAEAVSAVSAVAPSAAASAAVAFLLGAFLVLAFLGFEAGSCSSTSASSSALSPGPPKRASCCMKMIHAILCGGPLALQKAMQQATKQSRTIQPNQPRHACAAWTLKDEDCNQVAKFTAAVKGDTIK